VGVATGVFGHAVDNGEKGLGSGLGKPALGEESGATGTEEVRFVMTHESGSAKANVSRQ
jgi:hypothetical protein